MRIARYAAAGARTYGKKLESWKKNSKWPNSAAGAAEISCGTAW
jgi:hypothetical protein